MNEKQQNDIQFGENSEKKNINILSDFFDCELKETDGVRNAYDFIDEKQQIIIELKSRRNNIDKYPTTMVGTNKVVAGFKHIENGYKVFFAFQFIDGLFYYQLDDKTYQKSWERSGGRRDRGRAEYNLYTYIPTNLLNKIS